MHKQNGDIQAFLVILYVDINVFTLSFFGSIAYKSIAKAFLA